MFHVRDDIKQKFYKSFGKTEQTVEADLKIIKEWLETQPHLPEVMDDTSIRNMLNLCKFDLNKVKQKIDNYYTIRSKYFDMYKDSNPKLPELQKTMEQTYLSQHPQLLDDAHRVTFLRLKAPNTANPKAVAMIYLNFSEIRLHTDFMMDDVLVMDLGNLTFRDVCKITFPLLYKCIKINKDVYSLRVHAMYCVNCSSYINIIVKFAKLILPPKIFGRLKVYPDADILKKVFNIDMLPTDFGGNGSSLDELNEMTKQRLSEYEERFNLLDRLKVDESLRPKNC